MRIFNTLTRDKQELTPLKDNTLNIYACGPTVYNFIHIGNARPLCVFDVLRRYLEWRGYTVNFVQNFTDIDDKLIKKANEEGTTVPEIAKRYIEEFFVDSKGLNIREGATTSSRSIVVLPKNTQVTVMGYSPYDTDWYYVYCYYKGGYYYGFVNGDYLDM